MRIGAPYPVAMACLTRQRGPPSRSARSMYKKEAETYTKTESAETKNG